MPGIGQKILGGVTQALLLPVYCVAWLLGSPYLLTMLCIMSEVLVELVVSTVMAGVSLIVSAVILIEEDPRPLNDGPSIHLKSLYEREDSLKKKDKESSTKSLENALRPETIDTLINAPDDSFFDTKDLEDAEGEKLRGGKQNSKEDRLPSDEAKILAGKEPSQKSFENKSPGGSNTENIKSGASLNGPESTSQKEDEP